MTNELITYANGQLVLDVAVTPDRDTVWLTQDQMSMLFDTARSSIAYHIGNIFREGELDKDTSVEIFDRSESKASRPPAYYNLDVIISVGYRVKSQRGVEFRRWANAVLKQYILNGYAINQKRLAVLQKTVSIQTKMLADALEIEEAELLRAVKLYTDALMLLDQYDHQTLVKPIGTIPVYRLTVEDCRKMIAHMESSFHSAVFGIEKEPGKVEGILAAVYQNVFGQEVYPSAEEKAANLLYFIIKDHPYTDGCKRIGASLFLEFLDRNGLLIKNGKKVISDGTLVAVTLMIAESRPEEKEVMVSLVMNLLQ